MALRTVAKAALRRKKNYEHQLEQTSAQMLTVEREISSIETANINKETLDAMKNAQQAMKKIHGGLTIDKVDQTMEDLREQHAIGEEIAEALTQGNTSVGVDEDELDEELAELQQEELDNKMLRTGTVPVSDQVQRLPQVNTGESMLRPSSGHGREYVLTEVQSKANRYGWRKTTRKKSCGNCRRRWLCDTRYSLVWRTRRGYDILITAYSTLRNAMMITTAKTESRSMPLLAAAGEWLCGSRSPDDRFPRSTFQVL